MKTPWSYKEIIDFEYFCHEDRAVPEDQLHQRDRDIFLAVKDGLHSDGNPSRSELLRLWVSARTRSGFHAPESKSPGSFIEDALRLINGLAIIKGLFIGCVAGISFFSYSGTTPINVFHFFLFFIFSQVLLGLGAMLICLVRAMRPGTAVPSFYSLLLRGLLQRFATFIHKSLWQKLDSSQKTGFQYAFDIFRVQSQGYGALFYWPIFSLIQLFAVFFNLGLLGTTLGKIATTDLAFGWQSTLQISSQMLHKIVQAIALPWSWLLAKPGASPSLSEIEGSRIILKDGMFRLATGDLTSWWPFLVFALLVYGLCFRLILSVAGRIMEERTRSNLNFDSAPCLAVIRRMRTPVVTSQAPPEPDKACNTTHPFTDPAASDLSSSLVPQVVLVPDDIFGLCAWEKLAPLLTKHGFAIKSIQKFLAGYEEDEEIKNILINECRTADNGLFILMEGWMPPLVAFLSYLRDIREILPEATIITIGLVGRPMRFGFSPITPQDLAIWRKKLAMARDRHLAVLSLLPP